MKEPKIENLPNYRHRITTYYENGAVESIQEYNRKWELDGMRLIYFPLGSISQITNYKDVISISSPS